MTVPDDSVEHGVRVIVTSAPADQADSLATRLVEAAHVNCVNLLPGASAIYRWQGELERDRETWMWMETHRTRLDACLDALEAMHPYDVPKVLVLRPTDVADAYAAWVRGEVPPPATASPGTSHVPDV